MHENFDDREMPSLVKAFGADTREGKPLHKDEQ